MLTKLMVPNFYGYLILAFWKFDSSEWCATLHEKKTSERCGRFSQRTASLVSAGAFQVD